MIMTTAKVVQPVTFTMSVECDRGKRFGPSDQARLKFLDGSVLARFRFFDALIELLLFRTSLVVAFEGVGCNCDGVRKQHLY